MHRLLCTVTDYQIPLGWAEQSGDGDDDEEDDDDNQSFGSIDDLEDGQSIHSIFLMPTIYPLPIIFYR